jgi:hypothetical protein
VDMSLQGSSLRVKRDFNTRTIRPGAVPTRKSQAEHADPARNAM